MLPAWQSSKHEPRAFELNTEKLDIPFLFELYEGAFANASAYVILTSQWLNKISSQHLWVTVEQWLQYVARWGSQDPASIFVHSTMGCTLLTGIQPRANLSG